MHVEFFGIPRERSGIPEIELQVDTLGELLGALAVRFPAFGGLITPVGLHRSLAANLNGDAFVSDLRTPLASHDRILLLSADAGG